MTKWVGRPFVPSSIKSGCGNYKVNIVRVIQRPFRKDYRNDPEDVAVYEATFEDKTVIAKVFDIYHDKVCSKRAARESWALQLLGSQKCPYTPHLLAHFSSEPGGGMLDMYRQREVIVMTKLPGVEITNELLSQDFKQYWRIETAFHEAMSYMHSHVGIDNGSHHQGNALWDEVEDKCYIIDFERARYFRPHKAQDNFEAWFCAPPAPRNVPRRLKDGISAEDGSKVEDGIQVEDRAAAIEELQDQMSQAPLTGRPS